MAILLVAGGAFLPSTAWGSSTAEPSLGPSLTSELGQLFEAIVSNSSSEAAPLIFPASAYVTMKTGRIANPATDYADRLLAFYRLDLAAYHQAVTGGTPAHFVGIRLTGTTPGWIPAGVCENSFGYWHLPNVRVVYSQNGTEKSVLVASLISYNGKWFVVHLGPNPRPTNVGMVDGLSTGTAPAGPAGGC